MGSYVPGTEKERQEMLQTIGCNTVEELFAGLPEQIRLSEGPDLPEGKSEQEVMSIMEEAAGENRQTHPPDGKDRSFRIGRIASGFGRRTFGRYRAAPFGIAARRYCQRGIITNNTPCYRLSGETKRAIETRTDFPHHSFADQILSERRRTVRNRYCHDGWRWYRPCFRT